MKERNCIDEERCDSEKEVFNARVNEDEMIISINEYKELKARIKWQDACISGKNIDSQKTSRELERVNKENIQLKQGIINFIKSLGGNNG